MTDPLFCQKCGQPINPLAGAYVLRARLERPGEYPEVIVLIACLACAIPAWGHVRQLLRPNHPVHEALAQSQREAEPPSLEVLRLRGEAAHRFYEQLLEDAAKEVD